MPWSEQEFFDEALEQKHPMEVEAHLPERTKVAFRDNLGRIGGSLGSSRRPPARRTSKGLRKARPNRGRAEEKDPRTD